ncbi:hypothetical protein Tco_1238507 [Tanacetum coccineum]
MSDHILHVHSAKYLHPSAQEQQYKLYLTMKDDPQLQKNDVSICLALKIKFERLQNSAKRQKISEHGTFEIGGSSFGQDYDGEPCLTMSGNLEQSDEFDCWTNLSAIDYDVLPNEKVSQELVNEISQTVDEAKFFKVVDEMLRQQIEIIVPPYRPKPTPVVQSCQRDPKAPGLPLVNQDLLYLKKGNSGPDKIVLSLHKFLAVIFPDDDIEERTSRWVEKCMKRFNPYARYGELGHEHKFITDIVARRINGSIVSITESNYKNLNKNDIEDMYLLIVNHKVDDYAEVGLLWSLSVFIRSAVIWERFHDFQLGVESYQQQVNLTAPIITFPGIEKYKMFSIVSKPVYGIIYENSKKEKRVMRHHEVHKFCDAILKRVLEGLKSYNNYVKNAIKDVMLGVLNTLILKPMYKEFNALNKLESSRFDSLETRIHQTIRKHVRVKMSKIDEPLRQLETKVDKPSAGITQLVGLLSRIVKLLDKSAPQVRATVEGKKDSRAQLDNNTNDNIQILETSTPAQEEPQFADASIGQNSSALVVHLNFEENEEPPRKKLKVFMQIPTILTPVPLNSIRPTIFDSMPYDQFTTSLFGSGSS